MLRDITNISFTFPSHDDSCCPTDKQQSNHRADYEQLDLNDAIMGEGMGDDEPLFTFDEEEGSPSRDFPRPSPGGMPAQDLVANSRKRGSSGVDHPSSAKRSQHIPHPYHRYHPQEGSSGNVTSSSTLRSGSSPAYHNFYGHTYSSSTYQGESRPPSRGTPQQGGYYPGYSPYYRYYQERSQWDSRSFPPSASGTPKITYPPYESDDEDNPPSPPSSPGARASSTTATASTPEKVTEKMVTKSPFRSPPRNSSWIGSESKSNKAFRPSPFFQASPGIIGNYGSFEMGTPSGTLANVGFSPLVASFELDEDASIPFPLGEALGVGAGNLMGISRSPSHGNSEGTPSPTAIGRDRRRQRSPLSRYMNELSPINPPIAMDGTTRPTLHHDYHQQISSARRYYHPEVHNEGFAAANSASARKHPKAGAVTMSGVRNEPPSSRLDPGAEPKQLWPPSSDSSSKDRSLSKSGAPGPVRLEIGGTGSLTTRKTLEGINSMMQPRPTTHNKSSAERGSVVSGYSSTPGRPQPPPQHHHRSSHHSYSMGEMGTPSKAYSHMRSDHRSGRHHHSYPPPVGSGMKSMYPLKVDHHYSGGGPPKSMYMGHPPPREGNPMSQQHNGIPPSIGKENSKKKATPKRSPCNCKKSRCLKLYCECFAAERFCQGCNCSDCGNTPESGEVRDKAIKDTRAKNSKAFQNRFIVKNSQGTDAAQKVHNMGCKCKKSECLKKYCEVC